MKKLLLGIGTLAMVAVPTVSVVACSAGSVFKSKINSVQEAKDDVEEILNELKDKGTLSSDVDKYTNKFSAEEVLHLDKEHGIDSESLKGLTFDIDQLTLKQGKRTWGFRDWTASHNDFYSTLDLTLKDGSKAKADIYFKYAKTHGIWTSGKKSALFNAAIGVANLATKLKHVISDIEISKI